MTSPTQRQLSFDDVVNAVRLSFGPSAEVTAAGPLAGGSFGTVWWVDLADGRQAVLKTGPIEGVRILAYEAGMVAAEAEYLRLVEAAGLAAPMARLLHETPDWMFMTRLPGVPMTDLPADVDTSPVRFQSGAAIARLHTVNRLHAVTDAVTDAATDAVTHAVIDAVTDAQAPRFGYSGARPSGATWPEAYQQMMAALLDDARVWRVELPVAASLVGEVLAAHADLLASVTTPSLVHFDLWDGNVLSSADGTELTGIVDGERYFWGDPIFDFASPALFRDIFDNPDDPFVRGYASVTPFTVDDTVRRRLWLYQLYLYLVMIIEFPSRGRTPAAEPKLWAMTNDMIRTVVAKLAQPAG